MANRSTHPLNCVKSESYLLTAQLTGGGAADMTLPEAVFLGKGEVSAAARTGAGKFTITFRNLYPALLAVCGIGVVGTTDGLVGQFASIDVAAGTAALETYVGSTPTDPATTDTIYITWLVRNSGKNR